jgi:hypothetical protein
MERTEIQTAATLELNTLLKRLLSNFPTQAMAASSSSSPSAQNHSDAIHIDTKRLHAIYDDAMTSRSPLRVSVSMIVYK